MGLVNQSDYYYFNRGKDYYLLDIHNSYWYHVEELTVRTMDVAKDRATFAELEDSLCTLCHPDKAQELADELRQVLADGAFTATARPFSPIESNIKLQALTIHVANLCNLGCKYCYGEEGTYGKKPKLMSKEIGFKAIDFVIENFPKEEGYQTTFFGGEPLLNIEVMKSIIEYAESKEHSFKFNFTTNGTIYNDELLDYFRTHKVTFQISLDGDCTTHDRVRKTADGSGTYNQILGLLNLLKKKSMKLPTIRLTYTHFNPLLTQLAEHIEMLEIPEVVMAPVAATPGTEWNITLDDLEIILYEIEQLFELYKKALLEKQPFIVREPKKWLNNVIFYKKSNFGCGMGVNSLAVDVDGYIFPCHRFVGMDAFCVGSLDKGLNIERLKQIVSMTVEVREGCKECWLRYFCGGSCLQEVAQADGKIVEPEQGRCAILKKYMEESVVLYSYLLTRRKDVLERISQSTT